MQVCKPVKATAWPEEDPYISRNIRIILVDQYQ